MCCTGGIRRQERGSERDARMTCCGCRSSRRTTSRRPETRRSCRKRSRSWPASHSGPTRSSGTHASSPGSAAPRSMRHCLAAIERGRTAGAHGLPLFGSGDWNDGMNRVGIGGRGESVWLGWFLYATLTRFAGVSERMGDIDRAETLRRQAEELRARPRGERRGTGRGTGGDTTTTARRSGRRSAPSAGSTPWPSRGRSSLRRRTGRGRPPPMEAVVRHLVREEDGLILLLAPPFAGPDQDPGYIRGYPPGVRENGGQYTHAAIWVLWALAELGEVERAVSLFQRLLPIRHALIAEDGGPLPHRAVRDGLRRLLRTALERPGGLDVVHGRGGLGISPGPRSDPGPASLRRGVEPRPAYSGAAGPNSRSSCAMGPRSFAFMWRTPAV